MMMHRTKTGIKHYAFLIFMSGISAITMGAPLAYAQDSNAAHPVEEEETVEEQVEDSINSLDKKNYISLSVENDSLGGGTDAYYTSGVRLTYFNVNTTVPPFIDQAADAIPTFDLNDTTSTFFTLGQNIYTPDDITIATNQDDDRPWAGWLYGSVGLVTLQDNHADELEFTLGIVGPEALAENTQKFVHKHITPSPKPRGWDNQLKFEPGVIISAQRRWPQFMDYNFASHYLRAEPNVNVSLGNVYTYAGAGFNVKIGPDDGALQDTPPRVRPAVPGNGYFETPDRNWSWFIFGGIEGRAIARNIFLDGNTFTDSHSVDKKPLVADLNAGVALTYDQYRLSYSLNRRTKEFEGQDDDSVFGSLTFSTRF